MKAKTVIQAFYGSAPKLSYWNGCSTGGRQGLKEAQMFPDDYDGIIAGAPANRTAISLWIAHAVLKNPASYIPPAKYPAIHQAAVAPCDAGDGLKDGLIGDPTLVQLRSEGLAVQRRRRPDLSHGAASGRGEEDLFARDQPAHRQGMFASLVPGTELGWGVQALGPEPSTTSTISTATSSSKIRTGTGRPSTSTATSSVATCPRT